MWRGDKVELGPVQREYLAKYVEWLNDWETSRFVAAGVPALMNLEDETAWFEPRRKDQSSMVFAILALPEKQLIGNCGIHNLD